MASNSLSLELILMENVLKISLSKDSAKSSSGVRYDLTQLPQISRELSRFPHTHLMDDPTFIDNILIERFSVPQTEILSYSAESYALSRSESQKQLNVTNQRAQRFLSYLQEILVNYAALAILEPNMFPNQYPPSNFTGIELSSFRVMEFLQRGGSKDFLMQIVQYWNRETSGFCEEMFSCLNSQIKFKVKNMSLLDDPGLVAGIFKDLLEIKGISNQKIHETLYQDHWNGIQIEAESLFGNYLSPSLFPKPGYFNKIPGLPGPSDPVRERLGTEIKNIKYKVDFFRTLEKYSNSSKAYTIILTNIFKVFLKDNRKLAMDWLTGSVTSSSSKSKLANRLASGSTNTSPSDGFCMNLFDLLLQISSPFLNPRDDRVNKISEVYMACNKKMLKINETPLCNTIEKLQTPESEVGTVTEFYYCCCLMFHYSWHSARGLASDLNRVLSQLANKTSPAEKNDFDYYLQVRSCFDIILMDPYRNSLILKLNALTLHLLLRWAGFNGTLPLPSPSPVLSIIPEFFIEDVCEFLVSMLEMQTEILNTMSNEQLIDLLTVITVILNSPEHFTNPYIRAKFVKSFSLMLSGKTVGEISSVINVHSLFQQFFMQGLVKFYVDIEFGGGRSQFYDKYEYRHYASKIFEYLWRISLYQQNTVILQEQDYFKKFINYILNDMNYCLNDGIENLIKIKKFQTRKFTEKLSPEEEEEYSKIQGTCKYMMQQSNEYISLINQLSDWNSQMFVTEEFGERTAAMLNNYLNMLCGPKCLELKVENPKEFNFSPEELLGNLISIYLHIGRHEEFFECLIKDERSFSLNVFNKALQICMKKNIVNYENKALFVSFINKLKDYDGNKWEPEAQDIPEEFLCPISFDIMKNPVKLPSGPTVDRVSIIRHLLSDEHDPFNRTPLKPSELVEDSELKAKIEAWISEQKKKKKESKEA